MSIITWFKEAIMKRVNKVVYECEVCGTEVTVNSEGVSNLSPIYCCDIPLMRKDPTKARTSAPKQHAQRKTAKTTAVKPAMKVGRKTPAKPSRKR